MPPKIGKDKHSYDHTKMQVVQYSTCNYVHYPANGSSCLSHCRLGHPWLEIHHFQCWSVGGSLRCHTALYLAPAFSYAKLYPRSPVSCRLQVLLLVLNLGVTCTDDCHCLAVASLCSRGWSWQLMKSGQYCADVGQDCFHSSFSAPATT